MFSKGLKLFFEGVNSLIYLQEGNSNQDSFIIKVIKDELAPPTKLSQFKNEYNFTKDLAIGGIRKVRRIDSFERKTALYLDYFQGETIRKLIYESFIDLDKFFTIAIKVAQVLGEVHQNHIIHKDINSNNILVNPDTLDVNIIDFGIASRFTIKTQHLGNPEKLEGTLAYISPEQTGRMNRKIDYRTDIYSLGVTFYEMLSQTLPFQGGDTMEIVHAHIAKEPTLLHELPSGKFEIPMVLSQLVAKMMAKNAELRYQSVFSVQKDLEKIREGLANRTIHQLEIGTEDVLSQFQIPEKLYGREEELQVLNTSFEKVNQGSKELVLVQGNPGVGKSSLIAELYKPITSQKAYFIQGKFDQFQKNIPYFAWVQAIRQFVNLMLTENKEVLNQWKEKINQALDPIGQVLVDLIPDLELIIGPQIEVSEINPAEAQSRFNYILRRFIKVIANKEHPLVIFIDDWQWADKASIDLLLLLLEDHSLCHFMLIAAFRDNEISPIHPFHQTLEKVRESKTKKRQVAHTSQTITLYALNQHHIAQLIADTLFQKEEATQKLATLIYSKTGGNAFFVNQFLQTLYEQKLINFDFNKQAWEWDLQKIKQQNITDNVVELMAGKVQKLPSSTQDLLKIFACIGNKTNLETLAKIQQQNITQVFANLSLALSEELILFLGEQQQLAVLTQNQEIEGDFAIKVDFKFAHDRIQQAVYSLIADEDKAKLHLKIGWLLYETHNEQSLHKDIFQITNQLNSGGHLITDTNERYLLAQLNLNAGQKAKASAAFNQAHEYIHKGLKLLSDESWEIQYNLTLRLHNAGFETDYLVGNYDQIDHWMNLILSKTKDLSDQITGYKIKINALKANYQLLEAVETAEDIIGKLGVKLPKNPKVIHIIQHMIGLSMFYRGKKIETFADRPRVPDYQMDAIAEITDSVSRAVFFAKPNLLPILTSITNKAAYKHNHPLYAAVAYSSYGLILCAINGDIDIGYRFGQVAQAIIDKTESKNTKAVTMFTLHVFINHWKDPLADSIPFLEEIYPLAREAGNNEYAGFAINLKLIHNIYLGNNLSELLKHTEELDKVMPELNQPSVYIGFQSIYQFIWQLTQPTEVPELIKGDIYDPATQLTQQIEAKDNSTAFLFYVLQVQLAFLFGKFKLAYQKAVEGDQYIEGGTGTESIPVFYLYYSLSSLAHISHLTSTEKNKVLKKVQKILKKFKKWANKAPVNYQHRYLLIQAELAKVKGQFDKARNLYDEAIKLANQHQFTSEEAVAWEVAARFYIGRQQEKLADLYLKQAFQLYQYWGATQKVDALQTQYPQLSYQNTPQAAKSNTDHSTLASTTSGNYQNLDLESIVKGSQTLSGEIKLESLLQRMMDVVIENAGAQRGLLLLIQKDKLVIEAEVDIARQLFSFLESTPIEKVNGLTTNPKISSEIAHYVFRTQKSIVLQDASNEGEFTHLQYIKRVQPKSILCLPLIHQGNLSGLLYLENNLTTGAFTPARIQTLSLLSSQIAISLENALLYENLEEKVKERTNELNIAYEEIKDQNRNITASINYAKRIQEAMLPTLETIERGLPESFVLFRPRDIVSGDFYWYAEVGQKIIFAAIDCTGHGVPGAFMSMIGNDILNQIVEIDKETKADQILRKLHEGIRSVLKQEESNNRDGMDMALCVIDKQNREVEFSGAKNPLIYIQDNKLYEIKGGKLPIGGFQKEMMREFKSHTLKVEMPTVFYMFSDGYADQFGGEMGKKFMKKYFKKLFQEIHPQPMHEQRRLLNNQIIEWMGSKFKQTDDILVVGFKL